MYTVPVYPSAVNSSPRGNIVSPRSRIVPLARAVATAALYSSSVTFSNQFVVPMPGLTEIAICANQLSLIAERICLTPGGIRITSPACISRAGSPSISNTPTPSVTSSICPPSWACQSVLVHGSNVTCPNAGIFIVSLYSESQFIYETPVNTGAAGFRSPRANTFSIMSASRIVTVCGFSKVLYNQIVPQ